MQRGASNAQSGPTAEPAFGGPTRFDVDVANAADLATAELGARDAETLERVQASRQNAFAAGFVDRRVEAVEHLDVEPSLARGERGSEPRGATAEDERVHPPRHRSLTASGSGEGTSARRPAIARS